MKILHIDLGKEWRGGQRQVFTLHNGLLKKGIESHLVCNLNGELFKKSTQHRNENIHGFLHSKKIIDIKRSDINYFINKVKPDIIHCHDSLSAGLKISKNRNFKLVHTRRVSYKINFISRFIKYKKFDLHIAVGKNIQQYLLNYFVNVEVIPSCIDLLRFNQTDTFKFPEGQKNILFVGALTKQKGLHILLYAFAELIKKYSKLNLHIVGDGNLRLELKNIVNNLDLNEKVTFYGTRMDVEKFYKSCDYFVCPSIDGEGSNGTIKEALASGRTVIASNLIDNTDLMQDNVSGFFFENKNIDSLVLTLSSILDGKSFLNKKDILDQSKKFSCSINIERHVTTYSKLIKGVKY